MSSGLQTQRGGGNCHVSASLPASNPRTPSQARRSTECAYKRQGVAQQVAFPLGWAVPAACPCALQGVHTEARLSRHSAARAPVAAGEVLHPQQQRHAGLEDAALHPQPRGRLHPGARRRRRGAVPGEACCLLRGLGGEARTVPASGSVRVAAPNSDTTNGGVSPKDAGLVGLGSWDAQGVSLLRARSGQAEKVQDGFSVKTDAGWRPRQRSEERSPTQTCFPVDPAVSSQCPPTHPPPSSLLLPQCSHTTALPRSLISSSGKVICAGRHIKNRCRVWVMIHVQVPGDGIHGESKDP